MIDPAQVQAGLSRLQGETEQFDRIVAGLDAAGWATPTNLPGWDVKLLTAHLVRGAEAYITAIENGRRGELERRPTAEDRIRRMNELAALGPADLLTAFRDRAGAFEALVKGLMPDRLDVLGAHFYGPRTVGWFVDQRLAELFFHGWDLRTALQWSNDLDEDTARHVLPMLLESNVPTIANGTPAWAGALGIAVHGSPDLQWTVMMGPDAIAVHRGIAGEITELWGNAAALALLVYDRESLDALAQRGALEIHGKRSVVEQFLNALTAP